MYLMGGIPGLVVMGVDSRSKVRGFESRRRILDGHGIFHIHLLWKLYCLFEKTENKQKRGRGWPNFLQYVPSLRQLVFSALYSLCFQA